MNLITLYNINERVWFIDESSKAVSKKIHDIVICIYGSEITIANDKKGFDRTGEYESKKVAIKYYFAANNGEKYFRNESEVYPTKQDLIDSL